MHGSRARAHSRGFGDSRLALHPKSFICMLVLDFGRKARPTESKESLPRRSWSQGTTNAIKITLAEKAPSIDLVEGVY